MLIDPRGVLHATSGILPTKAIDIPPEKYKAALEAIEVPFMCSPILMDRGKYNLPLPTEPGYTWSWLEQRRGNGQDRGDCLEVLTTPMIEKQVFNKAFLQHLNEHSDKLWQHLLDKGWLKSIQSDITKAEIVPKDRRASETLEVVYALFESDIEEIFDLHQFRISPVSTKAVFSGTQQIREGWLVLRKVTQSKYS